MQHWWTRVLLTLAAGLACCSCGGRAAAPSPDTGPSPGAVQSEMLRDVSGAPSGVNVYWPFEPDPLIAGYHIYRSDEPIPGSARGDSSLWVEHLGSPLIAVPQGSPEVVSVVLLFPVAIGESWYFRVTAVDEGGSESYLSAETSVTIAGHIATRLEPTSAGVDYSVGIEGECFGKYSTSTDHVYFPGVEWQDGTGFVPVSLDAFIVDWKHTVLCFIRALVPMGATSGQLDVSVAGASSLTPEQFTNADPYLTSLSPLTASVADEVVLEGANFGAAPDAQHRVIFGGQVVPPNQYTQYSDTLISFFPPNLRPNFGSKEVLVRVFSEALQQDRDSNVGFCTLTNGPPTAALSADPLAGLTPLAVDFDASGSLDPEGTQLTFDYDWEGDGQYDLLDGGATPTHVYDLAGQYDATVRVTDADGGEDTASVQIDVTLSDVELTDSGSPPPGNLYEDSGGLTIQYNIQNGLGPYTIDWVLIDMTGGGETHLATDIDVPAGDGLHDFAIDTTTDMPVLDSNTIPLGVWRIRGEPTDQDPANDPDAPFTWPFYPPPGGALGEYAVYRHDVGIIQDVDGDAKGVESALVEGLLQDMGYNTAMYDSATVTLADLAAHHAIIWAADGAHGEEAGPFAWLGSTDLALIRGFVDSARSVIILGPPAFSSGAPFAIDPTFASDYQPFPQVTNWNTGVVLDNLDYTRQHDYLITYIGYQGLGGHDDHLGLYPNSTAQIYDFIPPMGRPISAAVRIAPPAAPVGNVYLGMFVVHSIQYVEPQTLTVGHLLDNIVAGTIANLP